VLIHFGNRDSDPDADGTDATDRRLGDHDIDLVSVVWSYSVQGVGARVSCVITHSFIGI
jgi:hypothetical protein